MKPKSVTFTLIAALTILFIMEIATHRMGNELALLKMGTLPINRQLNGEKWRIMTYSFLHLNWQHVILNLIALWWLGRIVEQLVGGVQFAVIYGVSVIVKG